MKHISVPLAFLLLLLPRFAFAQDPEIYVTGLLHNYCTDDTIQFTVTMPDTYSVSIIHTCGQGDVYDTVVDTTVYNIANATIRIPAPSSAGDYLYSLRLFDSLTNVTYPPQQVTVHPRLEMVHLYASDPIDCCGRGNSIVSNINNPNFYYQWSYAVAGGVWTTIANENSPTLSLTGRNLTGDSIYYYKLHIWDGTTHECANGYDSICIHTYDTVANEITIAMDTSTEPRLLWQSLGDGSPHRGYQYQWQSRHDTTEVWTSIDSAHAPTLALVVDGEARQYRLRITSPCDSAESNIISSDTIWNLYNIGIFVTGAVLGDTAVCYGESPHSLWVRTLPSSLTGVRYVWLKKAVGDSATNWDSCGSGTIYNPYPATGDTMYKVQIKSVASNLVLYTTDTKTIHVLQLTKPHIVANKDTTCSNITPGIMLHIDTLSLAELSTTYQWQNRSISSINWVDIGSATDTIYQLPQLTSSTLYRVKSTITTTTCSSYSDSLTITVLPKLNINTLAIEIDTNNLEMRITNGDTLSDALPYAWQYRIGNTANWNTLGSSRTHQLTLENLHGQYRLKIMTPCDSNIESNIIYADSIWNLYYVTGAVLGDSMVCYGEPPSRPLRIRTLPSTLINNARYVWLKKAVGDSDSNWDSCDTGTTYYPNPATDDTMYIVQIKKESSNLILYTTSPKTVHVRPQLITPGLIMSGEDTICHNSTTRISIDPSTVDNSYTYLWQKKTNHESDWENVREDTSLTVTLTVTTQYRVIATDNASCHAFSNNATITVLPELVAGSLRGENESAVCYQHSTMIQFATPPSGADSNYAYTWQKSPDSITYTTLVDSDPTRVSFETDPMEDRMFYRVVVASSRCATTDTTPPVRIDVWKIQPATVNTDESSLCEGDSAELVSSTRGGSGDYTYQWQSTDDTMIAVDILGATDANHTSVPLYATTYFRVKCTDNKCPEQVQYSNWQKIEVNALPLNQELNGATDNFCTPDTITYTLNYNNTDYQYSWNLDGSNGQILSQAPDRNEVIIYWDKATQNSTSLLKLTTTDRYTNCKRDNEFAIHLNSEYQRPEETLIKQKGANILICADSTNTAHYLWGMKRKPPYSNEIVPDSTWNRRYYQFKDFNTDKWNYFVEIYYAKGKQCNTRTFYHPNPDTSQSDNASTSLIVSPNPSQGEVTYTLNQSIDGDCLIQIFDATGHLVYTQANTGYEADTPIKIETQLKQGIYILSLTSEKIMLNKKIIVQ